MRRLRQLIAHARQTVSKAGGTADTYKALAAMLIDVLESIVDAGKIQFKFTVKPFGFAIVIPEEKDDGEIPPEK